MSHRLQVLIPESLHARVRKAAARKRQSSGEWVRQALEQALTQPRVGDAVERLSRLSAPTGDIDQLLAEIEAGRR